MTAADDVLTSPGVDVVLDLENGLELDDLRKRVGSYAVTTDYGQLAGAVAGVRHRKTGDSHVTFGPTAAAKTMYGLRPNACAPWDRPIRYRLGLSENDAAYRSYLQLVARALTKTAERAGVGVAKLPELVDRPESSPPKLIDEYLWMRITRSTTR